MPALLIRTSTLLPLLSMMGLASEKKEAMEVRDDVSHSRMWMVEAVFLESVLRADRSLVKERTPAITVFGVDEVVSWRTNSRPRPRLAPVTI